MPYRLCLITPSGFPISSSTNSHTRGKYLEGGHAQPLWELARDPNVWSYSIRFRPDPKPGWLPAWVTPQPAKPPAFVPVPPPDRWAVNDPLDFSKDGPKELEAFLIRNLPEGKAHYHAENVGLSLSALRDDPNPRVRWRDFLRVAARQGILRRFLDEIISKHEYAGLASTLGEWLKVAARTMVTVPPPISRSQA